MNIIALLLITATLIHGNIEKDDNFDYFELTLIYPTSVCRTKETVNDLCKVPVDASPWTIHGLWPNRNDGSFPQFCAGETKKFVLSKLVPIEKELERDWPNLFVTQSVSSLWKHEWIKHGTCAKIVEEVNDEIKYFNKSLALHKQFDIFGTLEKQGIVPSQKKSYSWLLLHQNLRSAYGKNVQFHCLEDKKTRKWLLADVRLCLTKNFQLMDCKEKLQQSQTSENPFLSTFQPCPADNIVYFPFGHSVNSNDFSAGQNEL